jgi:hypothetical protein
MTVVATTSTRPVKILLPSLLASSSDSLLIGKGAPGSQMNVESGYPAIILASAARRERSPDYLCRESAHDECQYLRSPEILDAA